MLFDFSRHRSPSFEHAFSFLQECVHAFLLVFGRKQEIEALAFHGQAFRQRRLESLEHRLLGQANRKRRLGGDLPGDALRDLDRHLGRHDLVDDAELVGALGAHRGARQHDLHRDVLAGGARPALGPASARDDAQVDLRLAEARAVAGDDQVTHQRHLAAAAQRVAVDRRDQRLLDAGERRPAARLIAQELVDPYGRVADDLRISVTDRCNFRCIYCMPAEGLKWLAREDILRFEEIVRLARIFVERYGVRTIRITGGEPLVRVKLEELIGMINAIDPTLDITMTTNGVLLRQKAQALKDAGLKRINISLDTLRMDTFKDMARSEAFERVMDGITASREAGLWPIKLNMVVMSGHNDDEVVDFARLARSEGYEVRFIEFMPLDGDNIWTNGQVVPSRRIQEQIEDLFPLEPVVDTRPGPATRYRFADGAVGGVGFISSVSQAFCTTCNRVRLTAEGGLRTCLFSLHETPLRDLMRSGVSDDHLGSVIEAAIWRKEEGHLINKPGFIKPAKSMSQIGG